MNKNYELKGFLPLLKCACSLLCRFFLTCDSEIRGDHNFQMNRSSSSAAAQMSTNFLEFVCKMRLDHKKILVGRRKGRCPTQMKMKCETHQGVYGSHISSRPQGATKAARTYATHLPGFFNFSNKENSTLRKKLKRTRDSNQSPILRGMNSCEQLRAGGKPAAVREGVGSSAIGSISNAASR